jgi:streptomycin 3"-kinase
MSVTLPSKLLRLLPGEWRSALDGVPARKITGGMSGASVFLLATRPPCYLKFARDDAAQTLRNEIERTAWLAHEGIRVAPIVRSHMDDAGVALQTQALAGETADHCDLPEEQALSAIGLALAKLHALPHSRCPFDESLAVRQQRAREAVSRGEIDPRHFASRNRNVTPAALLSRLLAAPPPEDLVVAHGDLTLSNIVVATDGAVGFLDCGFVGRADRYLDLAILAADIAEHFGRDSIKTFADAYGIPHWDADKARYYTDLYELF